MSTETTNDDETVDGPPADDSETFDPPSQGLGLGMPSLSSPVGGGLAMLATGGMAAGPMAYQGLAGLMQPGPDMQQRAGQAQALPPGYAAPVAPVQPQPLGPPVPPGGVPQKPVTPGSRAGVPGTAMPQMDWAKSQQDLDAANKESREGTVGAGEVEAKQAAALAESQAAAAKQQVDFATNMQQAQDAAYKQVTAEQTAIQKNMEELSKTKVDPSHWWNSRSTGQKAAAAFGLALSQMGAAFTHTPALDLVSKYVDQDIDAQKTNIENQRQTLNDRSNMLSKNYQVFQNWADAQKATKLQLMDGLLKQGQAQAAAMQPGLIKEQTLQKLGAMDQQNQAAKVDLFEKRHQTLVQDKGLQVQAANLQLEKEKLDIEKGKANNAQLGDLVPMPGGGFARATSPESAKVVSEKQQAFQEYTQGLTAYEKLLTSDPVAARDPSTPLGKQAEQMRHDLASARASFEAGKDSPARGALLKQFEDELPGAGTASDATGLIWNKLVPAPNSWLGKSLLERDRATLQAAHAGAQRSLNAAYGAHLLNGQQLEQKTSDEVQSDKADALARARGGK